MTEETLFQRDFTEEDEIELRVDETLKGKIELLDDCLCIYRDGFFMGNGTIRIVEPIEDPLLESLFISFACICLRNPRGKLLRSKIVRIVGKKMGTSDMIWTCEAVLPFRGVFSKVSYAEMSLLNTMNMLSNEQGNRDERIAFC